MQGRHLRVRARVGEVDRVPDAVLVQRLARVEVPAEERVDGQRGVAQDRRLVVADEVLGHRVAVVQRGARVVLDDLGLRAEADAAHEAVERVDRLLQVHDQLAALVVALAERLRVVDLDDALPAAAVERLHEHRVAQPLADGAEVEQARVALQRRLQIGQRLVRLGRQHPRLRDRHAQVHHGAVGRVLLHRLHRPRVVEDVEAVHQDGLLDPLAAGVIPVGQPVDDQVVADVLAQVERLDGHAVDLDAHLIALPVDDQIEALDELLVTDRPADVGAQRQPDPAGHVGHVNLLDSYSYTRSNGPGNSHERPSRRRSRQFSQLCPSRASTYRTSIPVACSIGTSERFS